MADRQQYLDFLCGLLAALDRPGLDVSESTELVADAGLSSLEVMEFIERVEDEFDISVPLNILPDVSTIGQLARKLAELDG